MIAASGYKSFPMLSLAKVDDSRSTDKSTEPFRLNLIPILQSSEGMHLKELQRMQDRFVMERGWNKFPASLVFVHLVEEIGEIGRYILFEEGYKVSGMGHEKHDGLKREFAQAFSLFLQIANHFHLDLERAVLAEAKVMEKRFDSEDWRSYMKKYETRRDAKARKTAK